MNLPKNERGNRTAEVWFSYNLERFGLSFAEAIRKNDPCLQRLNAALEDIERMIFRKGAIPEELLKLSITAERERQRAARQKEAEERKAAEEAARLGAAQRLDGDAETWLLNGAIHGLHGRTPLDLAQSSQAECDRALYALNRELWRKEEERERSARQAEDIRRLQDQLTAEAERILGKERATLFLHSPYPELERKRPIEFCKNQIGLNKSLELLKRVGRK
jgi:uncharacterized protein (DUF2384 family)